VPDTTPVPEMVAPLTTVPEPTAVTDRTLPAMEPVTEKVEAAIEPVVLAPVGGEPAAANVTAPVT